MSERATAGTLRKARGKIRGIWGELTDDDIERAHGNLDILVGTIMQKTGQAEESIRIRLAQLTEDDEDDTSR